ncbi:transporter substrate-binding domain-containing protein [Pseudoalteromonas sp. PS5]|uniref:substrate-binding periplasmic protein n=1 Tax=Pseudoalteromonas sp. PS5 TaxID=1437473 RepID=UPI000FFF1EA1|nr:transporter substrate-binding domain-containing protein [Pseudoalteromonas sp. PS5]RXF03283.1 amino acid ABC transporter substrate-binding protein [Pseudoalteromonas sp. PS5]
MPYTSYILLSLLLFCSAFEVIATCSKTLRVGLNEIYWPPYIEHQDNTLSGLEISALNTIFTRPAYCLKYIIYPSSARMFAEIQAGNIDLLVAATQTPDRVKYAHFTTAYRQETMALFQLKENPRTDMHIESLLLTDNTFAINNGSYYGDTFATLTQNHNNEQVIRLPNATRRFDLLRIGRVDYAIEDKLAGNHLIRSSSYTGIVYANVDAFSTPVRYMLSKKTITSDELSTINQLINAKQAELHALFMSDTKSGTL